MGKENRKKFPPRELDGAVAFKVVEYEMQWKVYIIADPKLVVLGVIHFRSQDSPNLYS